MRQAGEPRNTGEIANTFYNLVKELKDFVDTRGLKIAFDKDQNSYLMGVDFTEKLSPHTTWREEQDEMRKIIARHVARTHPDQLSEEN